MISIKSPREIKLMREAGRIVALVHQEMAKMIKPGVTTLELDQAAAKIIKDNDASASFLNYNGFPYSICASPNEVLVHGFPNQTKLKEGDIISIDVGAKYHGYHGDAARTYPVGKVTAEAKNLIAAAEQSLLEGLKLVKAGVPLRDICARIGEYCDDMGYSVPLDYTGHGVGSLLHEDPMIPNYATNSRVILKAGMTLAIEPMLHVGKPQTKTLSDNWTVITRDKSLSAHHENTILVTNDGYEVLTKLENKEG
ncbi:MAG: type I methionyl aminopeptidase [Erysipelotrichaceae bacterium]